MFFTLKNLIRHFAILVVSFALLFPCVWLLNKSYYTTISKVNYWEQKQIVSLLEFILKNSDEKLIRKDLAKSIEEINFFEIQIKKNDVLIINKPLKRYQLDNTSTKTYSFNNYSIQITKRKYYSSVEDYVHYIKVLFSQPANLFEHRSLAILLAHLTVLLLLEVMIMAISIKFRLKKLTESIKI